MMGKSNFNEAFNNAKNKMKGKPRTGKKTFSHPGKKSDGFKGAQHNAFKGKGFFDKENPDASGKEEIPPYSKDYSKRGKKPGGFNPFASKR